MVTIIDYKEATNKDGEIFNVLVLQGEVEMVKSKETGKYYATAKKARITSTFDEKVCQSLIGTQMPGEIQRVPCAAYQYQIPETGETITLEHTYEYNPEPVTTEDHVFESRANEITA